MPTQRSRPEMDGLGLGGLGRIARNVLRPRQPDGQTCGDRNYKPVVCNAPSSTVTSTLLACNLCSNRTNLMLSRLLSLLAALVAYAPASCEMHVFIHTDRATRPPPPGSGFVLHTGVSSEPKFHASSLSDPSVSHSNIYAPEKNSWMRQQARKFEWALQTARAHRAPEPWLLADTDVIIQCGAEALRRRFEAAQTDLLIGAEAGWWPNPDPRQNRTRIAAYRYASQIVGFCWVRGAALSGSWSSCSRSRKAPGRTRIGRA